MNIDRNPSKRTGISEDRSRLTSTYSETRLGLRPRLISWSIDDYHYYHYYHYHYHYHYDYHYYYHKDGH